MRIIDSLTAVAGPTGRRAWIGIAVVFGTALGGCRAPEPPTSPVSPVWQVSCERNKNDRRARDPHVIEPNRRGLTARNFIHSTVYETSKDLSDTSFVPESAVLFRETFLRASLADFLKSNLDLDPRYAAVLRPVLSDPELYKSLAEQKGAIARHIVLYNHEGFVDCPARTYHYLVGFWVPRDVLGAFDKRPWEERIDALVSERFRQWVGTGRREFRINIHEDILKPLFADRALREAVSDLLRQPDFLAGLKFVPPEEQAFIRSLAGVSVSVFPFASGEYRLSGEMVYTITAITRALVQARTVADRYRIVARGSADSRPLGEARPYKDGADLGLALNEAAPLTHTRPASAIASNLGLSIARGHSAARVIERTLRAEDPAGPLLEDLNLYYSGGGEVPGEVRDSHRRVDIVMIKQPR